jgi:glycosyltransferase involved in cell wall biosynthesis
MSRILFLSQLVPYPLDAGPKIRSYYVLRHLSQNHQVTLLAFSRPDDTPAHIKHLQDFCEEVYLVKMHRSFFRNLLAMVESLFSRKSFIIWRDFIPKMARKVDNLVKTKQFDAIHVDQLWMAQYALRARKIAPDLKLLLDEHNACFQIWKRLAVGERNPLKRLLLEREWKRLRQYEAYTCSQFDHVVTVTEENQNTLISLVDSQKNQSEQSGSQETQKKFSIIPICIDTQSIHPVKPTPGTLDILNVGTMFWLPNIEGVLWFAREVWPKVIAQIPQAIFTIAGKNPPAEIHELSKNGAERSSIQVIGYIPDLQPYLEKAGVFVVPLLSGSGMRVKIIDAWCWGLPIVSTSIGAEGIHHESGKNILIADDPEDFANAVLKILHEPLLAQKLRLNGRRWVEENYNWRKVYTQWDSIYSSFSEK